MYTRALVNHYKLSKMLSSVWDALTYHTLWGYLQCGKSTYNIIARL